MLRLKRFLGKFSTTQKTKGKQKEGGQTPEANTQNSERGWFTKNGDYDFDFIEQSVLSEPRGFGNPDSKWTVHEQFLLWKKMIQSGVFQSRDEYCKMLVNYSTYEQALQALNL